MRRVGFSVPHFHLTVDAQWLGTFLMASFSDMLSRAKLPLPITTLHLLRIHQEPLLPWRWGGGRLQSRKETQEQGGCRNREGGQTEHIRLYLEIALLDSDGK